MTAMRIVAVQALRESLRRRVFHVVAVLTLLAGGLYAIGVAEAFDTQELSTGPIDVDQRELTGATVLGLSMFVTLFLGAVLAAFLTLGAVRGDAESGLLQPVLVRPIRRWAVLMGRFAAAAVVAGPYAVVVYGGAVLATGAIGGWWPDHVVLNGLELGLAVVVVAAVALLGSVFLSPTANGIAVFMIFGAGLLAGLLGQVGEALSSERLERIGHVGSWVLPFEGLYQRALDGLVADGGGVTEVVVALGPFGGAQAASGWLLVWALVYVLGIGAVAVWAFARRDL